MTIRSAVPNYCCPKGRSVLHLCVSQANQSQAQLRPASPCHAEFSSTSGYFLLRHRVMMSYGYFLKAHDSCLLVSRLCPAQLVSHTFSAAVRKTPHKARFISLIRKLCGSGLCSDCVIYVLIRRRCCEVRRRSTTLLRRCFEDARKMLRR